MAYRSSSNTGNDSNVSSQAPAVPAGAVAGDVVVVVLSRWGNTSAVTAPAGFTDWGTAYLSGDSAANIRIYWKRLTGSDSGTYTFSWTGSAWSHAHVFCHSGRVATGNPIEAVNGWSGTAGSFGSTAVTTATIPDLIWSTYNDSNGTHTPPTGYTEVADFDSGSAAYKIGTATGSQTASGGSVTSSSPSAAILIALSPAGGGGSAAANTVTELDTGQALGRRKSKASATVGESDTSQPIARSKARGLTLTAETDAALGFTRAKRKDASQAVSAETAMPVGRLRPRALGTAASTELALPVGKVKSKALGLTGETDAALTVGSTSGTSQPISVATSTEQTLPIGHRWSRRLNTAFEFDTAMSAEFVNPAWRLVMPTVREKWTLKGSLTTSTYREATVFGDENGLFTTAQGSPSPGSDSSGAIPFGTKYIWYGGHVNTTDDPAVKNLWLTHGFEVENVQL